MARYTAFMHSLLWAALFTWIPIIVAQRRLPEGEVCWKPDECQIGLVCNGCTKKTCKRPDDPEMEEDSKCSKLTLFLKIGAIIVVVAVMSVGFVIYNVHKRDKRKNGQKLPEQAPEMPLENVKPSTNTEWLPPYGGDYRAPQDNGYRQPHPQPQQQQQWYNQQQNAGQQRFYNDQQA
ncbi:hypothetical protein HDU85_006892 [Gaertneriomyces sp. JEL0708]|nr:hypothetical protein HDU85_006892 [Gaertneriomyces sp. JEL0708]